MADGFEELGPRCVVIGAGFFGRVLVRRLLDEGLGVRVLDRQRHPALDGRAEFLRVDVRDLHGLGEAIRGATTVFHTVSIINLLGVARPEVIRQVHDVNVRGTEHVIEACRRDGQARLVYTSTNNVVFDRALDRVDETAPYARRAVDLYTQTKVLAEQRVIAAGARRRPPACALRPGGLWGPHEGSVMVDRILRHLARGSLVARVGRGSSMADNTHVDNLADAHLLAARALAREPEKVSGQAYFITDDEPMDPVDWFAPLVEALGYRLPSLRLPGRAMYGAAYLSEWLHRLGGPPPFLTRGEVLKVVRPHSASIAKARAHLGYEPKIKSARGLLECVPYARAYLARQKMH